MLKSRKGQKGFTLIELLIVVAIIGILAAVIIPNLITFLGTARLAAARSEAENVKTASLAFFADHSLWPETSANLTTPINYVSGALKGTYDFDDSHAGGLPESGTGKILDGAGTYFGNPSAFIWDFAGQTWIK